ncbi:MAG: cyclic nucleotide-binding domain-containing protein [Anaerolineae bacterium]|nr:cyclic nucleotide-binding domain-containing protein [Anaerolineae bacterium]
MSQDLLQKVSLFERLPDEALSQVAAVVSERSYSAGEVLFHKGDAGDELFIVSQGAITIYEPASGAAPAGDAERERPLRIFRSGESLGEMALIDLQPRTLSARAIEPTQVLVLSGNDFRSLLRDEDFALGVMSGLNERIRYTTEFLGEVREWVGRMANGQYRETAQFFDEVEGWVKRVAAGDYEGVAAPEGRYRDKTMAALAAEFARMATQVRQREDDLRKEIAELKIEIDQVKRQRQVEEITDSDFFRDIKTRAREMRRREK